MFFNTICEVCTNLYVKTATAKFCLDFRILTLYLEYFEIRFESLENT